MLSRRRHVVAASAATVMVLMMVMTVLAVLVVVVGLIESGSTAIGQDSAATSCTAGGTEAASIVSHAVTVITPSLGPDSATVKAAVASWMRGMGGALSSASLVAAVRLVPLRGPCCRSCRGWLWWWWRRCAVVMAVRAGRRGCLVYTS